MDYFSIIVRSTTNEIINNPWHQIALLYDLATQVQRALHHDAIAQRQC
jgi:hypothetical protein